MRNRTWAELKVGDSASIDRSCSVQDLFLFAHVSGNVNPLMLPVGRGRSATRPSPIAPSMWVGSLVSAVLGNLLPGPGTLYRSQDLRFLRRVHVGDRLKVTVTCREKREEPVAVFDTRIVDADGASSAREPPRSTRRPSTQITEARDLPALIVDTADHFAQSGRAGRASCRR